MIQNGFKQVDSDNNDFRLVINNYNLHKLCGTHDVSTFIKQQQSNYCAHVIRMSNERSLKQLMFNDDDSRKHGRPLKMLLEQVISNKNISIDELCRMSVSEKV